MELVACERCDDGWRLTLAQGDEQYVVVRSDEALRDLGRELQTVLDVSSPTALELQLRGLSQHPACAAMFSAASEGERKRKTAPWFVDCRIIEGRDVAAVAEVVMVSACLESQPLVRFVTPPLNVASADPVWNCEASFVCDDVQSDKLHLSLLTKRGLLIGKCAVPLESFASCSGPRSVWFNLRDAYDAVCIEQDVPLPEAMTVPFGHCSFGVLHLEIQVSQNAAQMSLSKAGIPLRWMPYRVQPGDVLFFSSKKLVTTGTKIATRSKWDHVALLTSYKNYRKLYVVQSTTSGVEVSEAESVLKSYWMSSRAIGVRRLLKPPDDARVVNGLADFAEKNVGKPYNFSFLGARKRAPNSGSQDPSTADKLFCSELVAAAFINTGVLSSDVVPGSFLPATLASKDVPTNTGYQLLKMVKLAVPSTKSPDVVWAREETNLRDAFRLTVMGRPFAPASSEAVKLLREVRKRMTFTAAFPYVAEERGELTLEEGDLLLVLEKDPTAWWMGQHMATGRVGCVCVCLCVFLVSSALLYFFLMVSFPLCGLFPFLCIALLFFCARPSFFPLF
jgi:uncharacterized protein YycO